MKKENYFILVGLFGLVALMVSSISGDSWLLLATIVAGILGLRLAKSRCKEVLDDERAYRISEKAGRIAFISYGIIGGLGVAILSQLKLSPELLLITKTISVSLGIMFLIYLSYYFYYSRKL